MPKTIQLEVPDGKTAKWVNGVLTLIDETPVNIMEVVKTFDDAWEVLGENHPYVKEFELLSELSCKKRLPISADLLAYYKLRIITAALNEGWEPQFTKDEWRWYAWYSLISKEEYDEMDEEDKSRCRVVGRASNNANAYGGLVYSIANNASSNSLTSHSSRLAFKSRELAEYAAKQFTDIYSDFCFLAEESSTGKENEE